MNMLLTNFKALYHIILVVSLVPVLIAAQDQEPKRIIYETDMCLDVDDAGGLAMLHAMANNGEAEILAVCFNEVHPHGAAAIDAMNTWYGRGDIPVGVYRGNLSNPDGSAYLEHVAKFPHDLEHADAPSALDVYRQVLTEQPDSSVTIVSVGFTNNLNDLLNSEPDLVSQKVKELVQMAGVHNDGFNLVRHNLVSVSQNVIENWPTPLVISQEGWNIYTGENYRDASEGNPFREAYYRFFGGNYEGRSSWDQMAVLYSVRGLGSYFNEITSGSGSLSNGYTWQMEPGHRSYLTNKLSNQSYERIIEELMDQLPIGAYFEISAPSFWIPAEVAFDASTTNIGGNREVQKYLWEFGDGTGGEGEVIHHEYTDTGTFHVRLTVIDNLNDSLKAADVIRISDPVFSAIPNFGNVLTYQRNQENLWATLVDSGDMRYYLSNKERFKDISLPGFCFVKDSIYSDFSLRITARTGEDLSQNSLADYAIIFGYEDENNYNQILMKHTSARVVNITDGNSLFLSGTGQDGIPDEHYHQVHVNLKGSQLTITLDDSVLLTKSSSRLIKNGKIGFGSSESSVFFDNIEIEGSGPSTGIEFSTNIPGQLRLWQNYPNPFNPYTKIKFSLPETENVKIEVYNTIGQKITSLLSKTLTAGSYEVMFNGENLHSGVYFYKLEAGEFQEIRKMVLLK
jgi:PKD repeat protein